MGKRKFMLTILFIAYLLYCKTYYSGRIINLTAEQNIWVLFKRKATNALTLDRGAENATNESDAKGLLTYGSSVEWPEFMQDPHKGARILLLAYGR